MRPSRNPELRLPSPCRIAPAVLAGLLAVHFATAACAQSWHRFSQAVEGFEVEFSGAVNRKPTDVAAALRPHVARAVTFEQVGRDLLLAVGVLHLKRPVQLDATIDVSFGMLGCRDRPPAEPLPVRGMSARELRGEGCLGGSMSAALRHFSRGTDVYQVLAIFSPARRAEAFRFLDSFRLLAPAVSSPSQVEASRLARLD